MSGRHRIRETRPGARWSLWLTPYTLAFYIAAVILLGRASYIALFG